MSLFSSIFSSKNNSAHDKTIKSNIPKHVAIIMDGNGRWARKRGLPKIMGHRSGAKSVDIITEECAKIGIDIKVSYLRFLKGILIIRPNIS